MKAEKTRKLLLLMVMTADIMPPKEETKAVDVELAELERLAEIGRATEKAFERFEEFGMACPFQISSTKDLVEWHAVELEDAAHEGKAGEGTK